MKLVFFASQRGVVQVEWVFLPT